MKLSRRHSSQLNLCQKGILYRRKWNAWECRKQVTDGGGMNHSLYCPFSYATVSLGPRLCDMCAPSILHICLLPFTQEPSALHAQLLSSMCIPWPLCGTSVVQVDLNILSHRGCDEGTLLHGGLVNVNQMQRAVLPPSPNQYWCGTNSIARWQDNARVLQWGI